MCSIESLGIFDTWIIFAHKKGVRATRSTERHLDFPPEDEGGGLRLSLYHGSCNGRPPDRVAHLAANVRPHSPDLRDTTGDVNSQREIGRAFGTDRAGPHNVSQFLNSEAFANPQAPRRLQPVRRTWAEARLR
jgi:hypothetical protein